MDLEATGLGCSLFAISTFCDSLGTELCEPLSFKGRMGTGIKGGRYNYKVSKLRTKYDWERTCGNIQ